MDSLKAFGKRLLLYAVLPNLLFALAGHYIYMMRPVVNLDYFLLALVAPWLPVPLLAVGYSLMLVNDILVNALPIYHFQISDLIFSVGSIEYLNPHFSLPLALGLAAGCLFAGFALVWFFESPHAKKKSAVCFAVLGVMIAVPDILNGTSFIGVPKRLVHLNFNVAYSGLRRTAMAVRDARRDEKLEFTPLPPGEFSTSPLWAQIRSGKFRAPSHVVVVVVESMGRYLDDAIEDDLNDALITEPVKNRYNIEMGTVPFRGMTMDGEFRALCGVQLFNKGRGVPECLPKLFSKAGYQTSAYHGFTSAFFNRYRWYPQLGFQQVHFAEDLRQAGLTRKCGSGFTGICDVDVAKKIGEEVEADPRITPKFIYWMTLNSHLPLDSDSSKGNHFDCSLYTETREFRSVCWHARMIHLVLESLEKIAADPRTADTEFVIVGDHSPAFVSEDRRALYSQQVVPFFRLTPKNPVKLVTHR